MSSNDTEIGKLAIKISHLCDGMKRVETSIQRVEDKLDNKIEKIGDHCNECEKGIYNEINNKLDSKTAYWLWGIYFVAGTILVGYVANHGMSISEHSINIQNIMTDIADLLSRCKG